MMRMEAARFHLQSADPVLADIIDRVGPYRLRVTESSFHGLAQSIVSQQLSGRAADTIFGRLTALACHPLTPESVLCLTSEQMRACGLSKQKSAYVLDLAAKTAAGTLDFAALAALPDDKVITRLTSVKGIGVWTAHMYLIFALGRPDILPVGDLGIRNAMRRHYRLRNPVTPAKMERVAAKWRPWRSVASWYLWRSLDL
jgi:DNA-3-methyladenine glycosylase II